jgi:hypothetical protein
LCTLQQPAAEMLPSVTTKAINIRKYEPDLTLWTKNGW